MGGTADAPAPAAAAAAAAATVQRLAGRGAAALAAVGDDELLAAWSATVERFRDPGSAERRALVEPLAQATGLSPAGLAAALEAVLGGVSREHAGALLARAAAARAGGGSPRAAGAAPPQAAGRPALAILAGNVPALAVQPLLPALAVRRPIVLKPASDEPWFTAAFVGALTARLPALADAVAVLPWRGGDDAVEAAVLPAVDPILAYGGRDAIAALRAKAGGRVADFGPKLSFAVVGAEVDPGAVAPGLARDVALFDQRGCLSVQAVFVAGGERARAVAAALLAALEEQAAALPPGRLDAAAAAQVQQLRLAAAMHGDQPAQPPLATGTVLLAEPPLAPSPGLRTVRVYPLADLAALPALLAPWRGLLQGAALAGAAALALAPALATLGVSRVSAPGELQSPDARWHNGGHDPLALLAGAPAAGSGPPRG